jgi:adenylate kinase
MTGICDVDGSPLHQRHDDERKTVEKRIREYQQKTAPLIDFYRQADKLMEIDGTLEIALVSKEILKRIDD